MKITASVLALLPALALASQARAAGPFDGTWVTKLETVTITGNPDTYLVADGVLTCDACVPQLKIKADGTDQKVTGHAYYDTASAKIVDAHTIEMNTSRGGKPVAKRTLTVSANGKSMVEQFATFDGAVSSTGKLNFSRVAPAPAGAHAVSGSWKPETQGSTLSSDQLTVTYQQTADGLKMSSPTGQSFDAKFDGKKSLIAGDPGKTMVTLKRIDERTIEETDMRQGKVTDVITYKVSADGKLMHTIDDDKMHNTSMSFTAEKK